jgi:hypothetical protein
LHALETALPEFVPFLAAAGVPAIVWLFLRYFPQVANALVVLLAGVVAIVTGNKDRRESCHEVLDKITRRGGPPSWPRRRAVPGRPRRR